MADTGWISPGTMAEYARSSGAVWTDEDQAKTQNDDYAESGIPKTEFSTYLGASNFSFGIPSGATIVGIETRYEAYSNLYGGYVKEEIVRLHKSGTQSGDDKATGVGVRHTDDEDDTYLEHGGAADMWSSGYDYDDVTSSTFGVLYAFNNTEDEFAGMAYVDHIQIKIHYTTPGYGNSVNDVPSANIGSINDVPTANIETVNDI